jgi:hypothetical protein
MDETLFNDGQRFLPGFPGPAGNFQTLIKIEQLEVAIHHRCNDSHLDHPQGLF